ncbi:cysteate racemase [Desulfocurvus sp. DL9XJH121]
MTEKTIGILGGMGPEATMRCYAEIIANTPADRDQDHIRVVMDANPKVPDRTDAILGRGPSPLPMLQAGCEALQRAGADFVIMPCISAHYWFDALAEVSPLPMLSMFDVVAEAIRGAHPEMDAVGLVGTTGTVRAGLFAARLTRAGIKAHVPTDADQERVMEAIYGIKGGEPPAALTAKLTSVSANLLAAGAKAIVASCTEIPLLLSQANLPGCPYFDSLRMLARAAILEAGREPVA